MRAEKSVDPTKLKKWLIALGVAYLLFPRDLIPDYLGRGLGLIDDALLIAFLTWFYRKRLREIAARTNAASGEGASREHTRRTQAGAPEGPLDPHEVLAVPPSASRETIDAAYKARMSEYHPDKVAHLGEELQKLAHRKALEIQAAYQQLRK